MSNDLAKPGLLERPESLAGRYGFIGGAGIGTLHIIIKNYHGQVAEHNYLAAHDHLVSLVSIQADIAVAEHTSRPTPEKTIIAQHVADQQTTVTALQAQRPSPNSFQEAAEPGMFGGLGALAAIGAVVVFRQLRHRHRVRKTAEEGLKELAVFANSPDLDLDFED